VNIWQWRSEVVASASDRMLDSLITAIVRPQRAEYSPLELGPPRIRYGDLEYHRDDFTVRITPSASPDFSSQVLNSRGLQIQGSYWSVMNSNLANTESCIVYLHPNSGARVDVMKNARFMSVAAATRSNVCSFDFCGCGESDGDCVSPLLLCLSCLTPPRSASG
jgi:hypothetical protein